MGILPFETNFLEVAHSIKEQMEGDHQHQLNDVIAGASNQQKCHIAQTSSAISQYIHKSSMFEHDLSKRVLGVIYLCG
ncbi:hypothetical protein HHE06_09220 [Helicobacter heilmannii]|nr:hypothetical protein ASB1_00820 [Helicobacter heilmannii]CRF49115.1 hypothetical protein HHE03_07120 [Helicobacter heilmannii]CRF51063.1 hypothetical protein HHE06_09220 [Helicobacter heilmannii]